VHGRGTAVGRQGEQPVRRVAAQVDPVAGVRLDEEVLVRLEAVGAQPLEEAIAPPPELPDGDRARETGDPAVPEPDEVVSCR